MTSHCNCIKPLPFFPKEFFPKDHRLFLKHDHVSATCPKHFTKIPVNIKKAKKYSYFFANSSNALPSNRQIAFL